MDFARGRLGSGINLHAEDTDLKPILLHVVDELKLIAPEREIIVQTELKAPVYCDAKRMAQLFSNLLSNAITHGDPTTSIMVYIISNTEQFALTVTNYGDLIPDSILPTLFEPFTRAHKDDFQEGLGLGLYISSEIAKAHGAVLSVESTDEKTTFSLNINQSNK